MVIKIVFSVLLLSAMPLCRSNQPRPLDNRVIDLYVELSKLQSTIPANTPAYQDSAGKIIALSGLTENAYRETIAYFCEEPERWEAFYKEVLNRLKENESPPPSSQQ
jgi:hypothetical protein